MVDLGLVDGAYGSGGAAAVNDNGQVVGTNFMTSGDTHAFSWTQDGGMIDLGTLGGGRSDAYAVSDSGHVVGASFIANGDTRAFSWTQAGGMVDLGTLGGFWSAAIAVNASGQVVGTTLTAAPQNRAFSWTQAEGMVELGTLGGKTGTASDINDAGQVIGSSTNADEHVHATLWNPAGDDTTPPKIDVPSGLTADATGPAGAAVTYMVTAADETDPKPTVLCNPPSGSTFPIGTTTVNCTAKDASGNQSTASFTVRVKGGQEQLQDLLHFVDSQKLGNGTSLHDKLVRALTLLPQGDVAGTCDTLNSFLASVRAQIGKSLPPAQAAALAANALQIENVIGC
jgi:probable HAF family extracellular repeat protein